MKRTLITIGIVIGTLLVVLIAVVVIDISVALSQPNASDGGPVQTTQVIVALTPIAQGSEFVWGSVGRRPWPAGNVPPSVIDNEAELLGKVAKTGIVKGQPIVRSLLTDQIDLAHASSVYAWCDIENGTTLVYSLSSEVEPVEDHNLVLGSSGVIRLQDIDNEKNQAQISCVRNGFGQVTVDFVNPSLTDQTTILYSCTLPLECQDGAVTVTTYSPTETK